MEIILELLFEIIIEGSFELATHKKVPFIIRILVGTLLLAFYGGLIGLIIFWGIKYSQPVVIVIGIVILLFTFLALKKIVRERRMK